MGNEKPESPVFMLAQPRSLGSAPDPQSLGACLRFSCHNPRRIHETKGHLSFLSDRGSNLASNLSDCVHICELRRTQTSSIVRLHDPWTIHSRKGNMTLPPDQSVFSVNAAW